MHNNMQCHAQSWRNASKTFQQEPSPPPSPRNDVRSAPPTAERTLRSERLCYVTGCRSCADKCACEAALQKPSAAAEGRGRARRSLRRNAGPGPHTRARASGIPVMLPEQRASAKPPAAAATTDAAAGPAAAAPAADVAPAAAASRRRRRRRRVGFLALLLGVYSLVLGFWYRSKFVRWEVGGKAHVLSGFCFVEVFADAVFIFIVWANNDQITKGILPKTLLVYFVCMGGSFCSLTPAFQLYDIKVTSWQALRLIGNVTLLLWIRGLFKGLWAEEPAEPIPTVASNVKAALEPSVAVDGDSGGERDDVPLVAARKGTSSLAVGDSAPAPVHRSTSARERSEPAEIVLSVTEFVSHK